MFFSFATVLSGGTLIEEIVARVGNEIITKTDYETELQRLREELTHRFQGEEFEKQFSEGKRLLLDYMINQRLLDQKARELDINVDEEINAAVERLRKENNIPDDQALETALRTEGSSLAQLREDFRKRIIQQKILWNYVQGKVNITEEELKTYYEQHKPEIITPPSTKLRRYAVTDDQMDKENLRIEAQAILDMLRNGQEIKAGDFPHLQIDEGVELTRHEMDPRFVKMIDATESGSYTDAIEISTGYMILKVEERKPPETVPFEEARGKIHNLLLQERSEKYQQNFFEDLRKQSYVVIKQTPS